MSSLHKFKIKYQNPYSKLSRTNSATFLWTQILVSNINLLLTCIVESMSLAKRYFQLDKNSLKCISLPKVQQCYMMQRVLLHFCNFQFIHSLVNINWCLTSEPTTWWKLEARKTTATKLQNKIEPSSYVCQMRSSKSFLINFQSQSLLHKSGHSKEERSLLHTWKS